MTKPRVYIIGIGAGNPKHLTVQAIEAMREADAVMAMDKGDKKADLLQLRKFFLEKYAPDTPLITVTDPERDRNPADYKAEVERWHQARADKLKAAMPSGTVAFLVWGDPNLYDSTLRIIERMGISDIEVIPGITSIQALTATFGLVLNKIGGPITITTGRQLENLSAPDPTENTVVMLDGHAAWQAHVTDNTYIWWGAYLGTENEVLREGFVKDIGDELAQLKADLRLKHGWIMDIYLLREVDRADVLMP